MSYTQVYNPCDDCPYSYSRNGQEMTECTICEFKADRTRYNLDAVLALLEEERCLAHDKCDGGASYKAYCKAIEIVKGGAE